MKFASKSVVIPNRESTKSSKSTSFRQVEIAHYNDSVHNSACVGNQYSVTNEKHVRNLPNIKREVNRFSLKH
jgi:hypothetical protein